ncbi:8756_t:CDS:2 [Paraglomus occultum]|uniref:8756_t:CDS:1 n=1 Tax=Paraglomus occultum TaxID=144539 RepID=A0A9N8VRS1_9GLOM|nr:8756_t:CDS:2 [Paraglomus occultum]
MPCPPHSDLESGNLPPSYGTQPPAPEPVHVRGKKHEATTDSYKAGNRYTQQHPPQLKLSSEDAISGRGGASTYQIVPEPSISERQLAVVSENGRVVQFNKSRGTMVSTMVQANYPMFVPSDAVDVNGDECVEDNKLIRESPQIKTEEGDPVPILVDDQTPDESKELHYFEVTVLSNPKPKDTTIAIGLATKPYPPFRLPGWNLYSVGYHSDDGRKFNDAYGGRDYGPEWGKVGDTVGCGYYPNTGFVFFTKNGENIGYAFTGMRYLWYPTVGAHGPCKVKINFGDDEPFRYCEARGFGPSGKERSKEC